MKLKDEIIRIENQTNQIQNIREDITDLMKNLEV